MKQSIEYLSRQVFVAWLDFESIPLNVDRVTRCSVAEDCKDLSDRNLHRLASLVTAWKVKVQVCSHITVVFTWLSKILVLHYHATRLAQKTRATFYPIRSKTNHNAFAHAFLRFSSYCIYILLLFWLVHWIFCVPCDWLEWLLFCFGFTTLKKQKNKRNNTKAGSRRQF